MYGLILQLLGASLVAGKKENIRWKSVRIWLKRYLGKPAKGIEKNKHLQEKNCGNKC